MYLHVFATDVCKTSLIYVLWHDKFDVWKFFFFVLYAKHEKLLIWRNIGPFSGFLKIHGGHAHGPFK